MIELSLTPATIHLVAAQNQTLTETITVTNQNDQTSSFEAFLADYQASDRPHTSIQFLPAGSLSDSIKSFATLDPVRFQLGPHASQALTVRLHIPQILEPGRYQGAVLTGPVLPNLATTNSTNLYVTGNVGTLIGVEVTGQSHAVQSVGSTLIPPAGQGLFVLLLVGILSVGLAQWFRRINRRGKGEAKL